MIKDHPFFLHRSSLLPRYSNISGQFRHLGSGLQSIDIISLPYPIYRIPVEGRILDDGPHLSIFSDFPSLRVTPPAECAARPPRKIKVHFDQSMHPTVFSMARARSAAAAARAVATAARSSADRRSSSI